MTRLRRFPVVLACVALSLAGCQTPGGDWRRANVRGDWLLTRLSALHTVKTLAPQVSQDLERERLEIDRRIRTVQRDGQGAYRDDDAAGIRAAVEQLEALELEVDALAAKYGDDAATN